jgi:hypothetical protein
MPAINLILALTVIARTPQKTGATSHKVTQGQFEEWKKDLNNCDGAKMMRSVP